MADWDTLLSGESKSKPQGNIDWDSALSNKKEPQLTKVDDVSAKDNRYDPNVGTGAYIWNEIKKVPGGLVGLPFDVVDYLAKKFEGKTSTDFGNTTRTFQRAMGADLEMKPPTPGTERLGTLVQNVVGSLPFAAVALPVRGALGAATELMSGLGGGLGQIMGKEVSGGDNPVAEIAGNVLGSMSGYRAGNIVEKAVPLAKTAFNMMSSKESRIEAALKAQGLIEGSPEYKKALEAGLASAKNEILDDLSKAYAQEDMAKIKDLLDQYDVIKQKFPGFRASLGEVTKNEPALAMQSKIESRNIPSLEERGARIRANQQSIENARANLVPILPNASRATLRSVQSTLDDELRALGDKESLLKNDLDSASSKIEAAATPMSVAGADIKQAAIEGYNASKKKVDELYSNFRSKIPEELQANAGGVLDKIKELRSKFVFDKEPEVLSLFSKEIQSKAPFSTPISVLQLDDLSAVANRDIMREMSKSNPDRKVIAQLQAIKTEAQDAISKALVESGNTDALSAYNAARTYFREEHAPKYLEGINLKLRMKDALNEERVKPENVVSAYFKPNGITEARRFNTQFADNGPAKEMLARGVFDLYKREVIDKSGGVINQLAHDSFMRKYGATLQEYPWIAARLEKNNVAGEISRRMEQIRQQRGEIAASDVAKAVGTKDADAFIEKAVSDKRFMFNALSKMKPEDRKNMAIAVLNKGWDESAKGSAAVRKFLENEDNVKMLFRMGFGTKTGIEHLNNLKLLARALEINESAPKVAPMSALAEDTLKAKTGTTFIQVMSALRAMGRRPGSGDWFAMVFGSQFIKSKVDARKNEILKEQLFDPSLLSATLDEARKKGSMNLSGMADQASSRGKQIVSKLWDFTKAAVGQGAPTAAAKRLPIAIATSEDQQP